MTHRRRTKFAAALTAAALALLGAGAAAAATAYAEHDFVMKDFRFRSGESLPEVKIHYYTAGQPHRNAAGEIDNAVLLLHGTGGSGRSLQAPQFADVLMAPGGLLDPAKYFIVLPDDLGHGNSTKPSDGLHARFPHYDYTDMVVAEHALITQGLGVKQLRLILGTSMGCMHAFMWGEMWPDGSRALMPLACQPVEIAGRNRLWRRMAIDAITSDPAYMGGEYRTPPLQGLKTAQDLQIIAGSSTIPLQAEHPTGASVDAWFAREIERRLTSQDANDLVYAIASSRTYDPSKDLEKITAPVTWVNSADDFINPPELGIAEKMARRLTKGRFVLIPASEKTHGHGTHTWAAIWKDELAALLKRSER